MEMFLFIMLWILDVIANAVMIFSVSVILTGLFVITELIIIEVYSILKHRRSKWRYRDGTNDRRKRDNCKES